jgi:hypothetical protein
MAILANLNSTTRASGRALFPLIALCAVASCGGGGGGGGSGSKSGGNLQEVSNGFGLLLPHQVHKADAQGNPTTEIVAIRSFADLVENVTLANPVLPVTEWPLVAGLPNGEPGNHYVYAQFDQPIDIDSVLDPAATGQANNGLKGTITVVELDPSTGQTTQLKGRAFIGGKIYSGTPTGNPPALQLQQWVQLDGAGKPVAVDIGGKKPGLGFPGTESASYSSGAKLLSDRTFVFVVDTDGDLSTHETFPTNRQIRLQATTAVKFQGGKALTTPVVANSTVGQDTLPPEVSLTAPPNSVPVTTPSFGDSGVDPSTQITISFTEPLQPLSVGPLPTGKAPPISSSIQIAFGPTTQVTQVPFTALPKSIYDFTTWELTPLFAFPGIGPSSLECGTFSTITVNIVPQQIQDLASGNVNTLPASTSFTTGEGPGLVNAPVSPGVIYAVRQGSNPGLSVIDLDGFGQGTGDPTFDFTYASFPKGNSNFPNNPNLKLQGQAIRPQISPGTCTVDGGSQGVFTLTRDSNLNTLLAASPILTSVGDVMIGQSLDLVFNNAKDSSGCQSGGGNICALTGLKQIQASYGSNTQTTNIVPANVPNQPLVGNATQVTGGANPISWSPHPNPPAMVFPPLCVQPYIATQEPTAWYTIEPPPPTGGGLGLQNLLIPGDPLGDPLNGLPPSGLLSSLQNVWFEGPDIIGTPLAGCAQYMIRQQVGHFLYVIDRARREIVVFNSNRFQVLDRIQVSDPTDLAMAPNVDYLAVSNQNSDIVQFIDIDPKSGTFHKVVKSTAVGRGPRGIAWDPANEDILVCNETDSTVSVISAFNFEVRKTVKSQLNLPFDVVITQRQSGFGFQRNVYFGWILNRNGDMAIFESGPSGVNGWGYDDVIGVVPMQFNEPQRLSVDINNLFGAVWVVHQNQLDFNGNPTGQQGGAISNVIMESSTFGQLQLGGTFGSQVPTFRDITYRVRTSIGSDQLTGTPVDIAFDDLINFGAVPNYFGVSPQFSAGVPAPINGKSIVRRGSTFAPEPAKRSFYMFVAVPNSSEGPGAVDVINIQAGNVRFDTDPYVDGVQSIPVSSVSAVIDYWRQ